MSSTPETNVEIIQALQAVNTASQTERFVVIGSIARGILLGNDVLDLVDPAGKRFQDVDAIDTTNTFRGEYSFMSGELDLQPTQTVRPTQTDPSIWGYFDTTEKSNPDAEPVSTFPASALGIEQRPYSLMHPGKTIPIPSMRGLVYLSNFFAYSHQMPKHRAQIASLTEQSDDIPELNQAYREYIQKMRERYPLGAYGRTRMLFFDLAPSLALSLQQSQLGKQFRVIRGTDPLRTKPQLSIEELSKKTS